ncbi:lytic transglycosylase domain-containing protein [Tengunoibacter tsumagoiensis]|uniref:Transglycosylase SLT domain-containing protein n=1 Tax=Tengunoibacter tsumagoiensis TaxID=2014871 RepID=A0A402A9T2_9CHLR|nr:lytic transglycosylase domain-containing protein [Tengunoibacter tsumagoiensis]GCE15913.1 hypothetical protein KTT_57720 [Tengunoibacter tsumagoiensis]
MLNPTTLHPVRRTNKKQTTGWSAAVAGSVAGLALVGVMGFQAITNAPQAHAAAAQPSTSSTIQYVQTSPVAAVSPYVATARAAATRHGINPDLFVRQIQQESGFNPNARSSAGAIGIAQFMPATAASMGVNPRDPNAALDGAARLMADNNRMYGGDYAKALAAYNAGPGTVNAAVRAGGARWLAYTPAETQHYVHVIMGK